MKALGFLASAYATSTSHTNADVIAAAHAGAINEQAAAVTAARDKAQSLRDSLNAQILNVQNPDVYTGGTFTYVEQDTVMVPMPGMPNVMMPMQTQSNATVTVTMNVTDYSRMVTNFNNWTTNHAADLAAHQYGATPDSDKIYGNILLDFASARGWTVTWQQSTNYWYAAVTDIPFVLDATDIASELTRIGFRR